MRELILAVQFLTRLPTPQLRDFDPAWLAGCGRWFAPVGALIGALLLLPWQPLAQVEPWLAAALTLLLWVWLTGALHLDGLADLADDYYEYDADNYRVVGRKSGRVIGFGQVVKVKVKATDIERRSIELELLSIEGRTFKKTAASRKVIPGKRQRGRRR